MYEALDNLPENPTPESLLGRLCSLDVPSDMPAFKERYVEVSKEDIELFFSPEEPELKENLFGPLRQAKMNYLLGNYIGSIALCGIVAEKVAILIHLMNTSCANCHELYQRSAQVRRVSLLKKRGLIETQSRTDFESIRKARNSVLHNWNTPDDAIANKAVQTYCAAARLVLKMMDANPVSGALSLNPEFMKYLDDRGEISADKDDNSHALYGVPGRSELMRLYMTKKERDELVSLQSTFLSILNDEHASEEEKRAASQQVAALSGALLSPLLPIGIVRNVLMFMFFLIGIFAFLTPYTWLSLSFLPALVFSPRVMGELAYRSGRVQRVFGSSTSA
ncbi:MAG: hypothetical protein OXC95_16555 [Dehalococcoidia bacterium]|nr:hypothetical protein [Dehalococcoidia bacterium]